MQLSREFKDSNLTHDQKYELEQSIYCADSGTANTEYSRLFFGQAVNSFFPSGYGHAHVADALHGALQAMKPQDIIESQLCTKILILNNQAMNYMASAANTKQTEQGVDININRATKLWRLHAEAVESLNRYRRKGEQKVLVQHQHINVSDGGKAIVTGGGECEKK